MASTTEDAITTTAISEELGFELEALLATYGDEHVVVEAGKADPSAQSSLTVVTMAVGPRGCDAHEAFVAARLELRIPPTYPAQAPVVQLTDVKGGGGEGGGGPGVCTVQVVLRRSNSSASSPPACGHLFPGTHTPSPCRPQRRAAGAHPRRTGG